MGGVIITVIMLTYNREQFVSRAIESILAQTFCDFEYIIVDNGSTDNSGKIADDYLTRDNRISVIHKSRGTIGSGRNAGLDAAKGEYIAFIDDDDWCEPDFLQFLYSLATENDADVSICGAADKPFNEKRVMSAEESLIELMWRKKYNMAFPTKMFSKKLAAQIRFPEGDKFDDISQMYKLLALAERVAYHGLPKYTFYRHEGNNSSWTTNYTLLTPETLDEYLQSHRERTRWLTELFPNYADFWLYFEWSFMVSMVEKINRLNIADCDKQLNMMLAVLRQNRQKFTSFTELQNFEKEWIEKYV